MDPPHRIVATFVFEDYPSSTDTVVFEPVEGGTLVHGHTVHESIFNRDMHVDSGMAGGLRESYERIDDLLNEQA